MLPASLRHPSVVLCALSCVLATGVLTAHAFFPRSSLSACPWPASGARTSDCFMAEPLPPPALNLVDADGKPVTLETLKGRVWLCDFFLTRCQGICPALNARFTALDHALSADPKYANVGLLSIAVDPAHDTPEVLKRHRAQLRLGADSRWIHATGRDQAATWRMVEEGFKLPVGASDGDPSTPVMHSDKIVLVDATGRIRGYYGGRDDKEVEMLKNDLDWLLAQGGAETPVRGK